MLFLLALLLAFAFAYFCRNPLKQHPYYFYAAAAVITVIVSTVTFRGLPVFVNTYIIGLFSRGAFGTALWAVVMWTGAFPNGSKPIKVFMPIRGELSIFAAILTLGHNIGYGKTYFVRLFTDAKHMSDAQLTASILTIAMLMIMLPLTVMSFPQVRKKMNAKLWKRIQRTAYLFYAMIYLHIMVLFMPFAKAGREGYFLSILIYSAVFLGYAVCRIRKWYIVRKKPESTKVLNAVCIAAFIVLMAVPCIYASVGTSRSNTRTENQSISAIETTDVAEITTTSTTTSASSELVTTTTTTTTVSETTETVTSSSTESVTDTVTEEAEIAVTEVKTTAASVVKTEAVQTPEAPPTEPEPVYIYNNGTYTGTAYGYDGDVKVTVTIENDVITNITGVTYESDTWYYDSASAYVIPQIVAGQNTQVDAYSGATYSSNAIMTAVANALNKARR